VAVGRQIGKRIADLQICLVEMIAPQNCIWVEPVQILSDTSSHFLDLLIYEYSYFSVIPGKGCSVPGKSPRQACSFFLISPHTVTNDVCMYGVWWENKLQCSFGNGLCLMCWNPDENNISVNYVTFGATKSASCEIR
jgi:hypothetical protein